MGESSLTVVEGEVAVELEGGVEVVVVQELVDVVEETGGAVDVSDSEGCAEKGGLLT